MSILKGLADLSREMKLSGLDVSNIKINMDDPHGIALRVFEEETSEYTHCTSNRDFSCMGVRIQFDRRIS